MPCQLFETTQPGITAATGATARRYQLSWRHITRRYRPAAVWQHKLDQQERMSCAIMHHTNRYSPRAHTLRQSWPFCSWSFNPILLPLLQESPLLIAPSPSDLRMTQAPRSAILTLHGLIGRGQGLKSLRGKIFHSLTLVQRGKQAAGGCYDAAGAHTIFGRMTQEPSSPILTIKLTGRTREKRPKAECWQCCAECYYNDSEPRGAVLPPCR